MTIHPYAQSGALVRVPSLHQKDAKFQLHQCYHRYVELRGINAVEPRDDFDVGLAIAGFAQLRNHVGIEQEHQEKSAGRGKSRDRGGASSISDSPGIESAATMLRR
ncbi:hypothetical protein D9M68_945660 [compost metagenome]